MRTLVFRAKCEPVQRTIFLILIIDISCIVGDKQMVTLEPLVCQSDCSVVVRRINTFPSLSTLTVRKPRTFRNITSGNQQLTPGKFATEYKTQVIQIRNAFGGPKVLASSVLPRPRNNKTTTGYVLAFNEELQDMVATHDLNVFCKSY